MVGRSEPQALVLCDVGGGAWNGGGWARVDHQFWLDRVDDHAARACPYSAIKAAMHGMSRSLAKEFGPHGVRVNTVVTGWMMTEKQLSQVPGSSSS